MKFHALLPVRDEDDIIAECLDNLLGWCDAIYIFDTGSIDSTWLIINEYAQEDRRIVILGRERVYFSEARLRGWMFDKARPHFHDGDWVLRADADEIHHVSPREFVRERLRPTESLVYHQHYNFVLREGDVATQAAQSDAAAKARSSMTQSLRWFRTDTYTEPRMFRYRESMKWPPTRSLPFNAGYLAVERLPIRHYPHRSVQQLTRRSLLRILSMIYEGRQNFTGYSRQHVQNLVSKNAPAGGGDGMLVDKQVLAAVRRDWQRFIVKDTDRSIHMWRSGEALNEVRHLNHLAVPYRRVLQRILNQYFLTATDFVRPTWPSEVEPEKIPELVADSIENEMMRMLRVGNDDVGITEV